MSKFLRVSGTILTLLGIVLGTILTLLGMVLGIAGTMYEILPRCLPCSSIVGVVFFIVGLILLCTCLENLEKDDI